MFENVTILLACPTSPLIAILQRIVKRAMTERGWPEPVFVGAGPADVELALVKGIASQGFRIESGLDGLVRIAASDERGLFYGMGKWLRRSGMEAGVFKPCAWRGVSTPRLPMRGIYFATHFHNFYHDAPLAEVERYIEELAMWGINALNVWFDMHHFTGIDDPAAAAMLDRLKAMLRAARGVGMSAGIGVLANEGYATTPAHLRAVNTDRGHYGVEVCVATPEGEALVLENVRRELESFRTVGLDHCWIWPYDQGGCGCPACAPWGRNGMLKIGEKVARLFRSLYPKGNVIFSTWLFDYGQEQGEWAGLAKAFAKKPDWVDYVMADSHTRYPRYPLEHGVPGGLPLLNFPEISMWGMSPWGGFGANPLLRRFAGLWGEVAHLADGGFPYSEGIYEDINKIAYAHFYWTGQKDCREAMEEYARYEWGTEAFDKVFRILGTLEANHGLDGVSAEKVTFSQAANAREAETAVRLCAEAEAGMPEWGECAWRWRILKLRALLDREIIGNGGVPTPMCGAALRELMAIYHAEAADGIVRPPV